MEERLTRIEKALDAAMPGWRNEETWPAGIRRRRDGPDLPAAFTGQSDQAKELYVDEEQTKRDREALGFDPAPQGSDAPQGQEAIDEERRLDEETKREQEKAKAERDAMLRNKEPLKAADQYADPPGGAMKQPEGDAPAPLAAPPGAAGGGRPPAEQAGQAGATGK